jgi:hypothetical protein
MKINKFAKINENVVRCSRIKSDEKGRRNHQGGEVKITKQKKL